MTRKFQPSEIALLDQMAAGRDDMRRDLLAMCKKRPKLAAEALTYLSVTVVTAAMKSSDDSAVIEKLAAVGNPVLMTALKTGERSIAKVLADTDTKENPDA